MVKIFLGEKYEMFEKYIIGEGFQDGERCTYLAIHEIGTDIVCCLDSENKSVILCQQDMDANSFYNFIMDKLEKHDELKGLDDYILYKELVEKETRVCQEGKSLVPIVILDRKSG